MVKITVGIEGRNIKMDMLQSGLIVAAVILVLVFCSVIKAACRRILSKSSRNGKRKQRGNADN